MNKFEKRMASENEHLSEYDKARAGFGSIRKYPINKFAKIAKTVSTVNKKKLDQFENEFQAFITKIKQEQAANLNNPTIEEPIVKPEPVVEVEPVVDVESKKSSRRKTTIVENSEE